MIKTLYAFIINIWYQLVQMLAPTGYILNEQRQTITKLSDEIVSLKKILKIIEATWTDCSCEEDSVTIPGEIITQIHDLNIYRQNF